MLTLGTKHLGGEACPRVGASENCRPVEIPLILIQILSAMRFLAAICLIALAAGVAFAADEPNPDREAVVTAVNKLLTSWKAGDVNGVAAIYTDDAREYFSTFTLYGKENIRKHIESMSQI